MTKTLKLVFLGSLVLNIVLIGWILGRVPRELDRASWRRQQLEHALKNLPEPVRADFNEKFSQIRAAADPLRDEIETARSEALRLIGAEPFDEAAYDRQAKKIQDLRAERFSRMGAAAKKIAKELPPEERRMFADLLRRPAPPSR